MGRDSQSADGVLKLDQIVRRGCRSRDDERAPTLDTGTTAKRARTGRIFIDCLRNVRGVTALAAYPTIARPGAPVSTPIAWDELPTLRSGNQYRVVNMAARMPNLIGDPWPDFGTVDQVVPVSKRRRS